MRTIALATCTLALAFAGLAGSAAAAPPSHTIHPDACGSAAFDPAVSGGTVSGRGTTFCDGGGRFFGLTVTLYRDGVAVATASANGAPNATGAGATATYTCPSGTSTNSYYTYTHGTYGNATSSTVSLTCTGP